MPEVGGVSHRFVEVRGVRLHVAEAGAGPPLVLLHGWPQHWYLWRGVIPRVAQRHRVICPDLRGHGWSDAPAGSYAKEELASDLLALLDRLGIDGPVRLAGHDWGGWTGFLACLRAPERFERFVALGIAPPFQSADPRMAREAWRLGYQLLVAAPGLGAALMRDGRFVRRLLKGAARRGTFSAAELAAFAEPLREPARARASVAMYRTFLTREAVPVLRGRYRATDLRVPTTLIAGAHDPVIRPPMLPRERPGLTVEVLPRHGHFLVDEDPALVAERILAAPAPVSAP